MTRQYELAERVLSYDTTADEQALNKAYIYAMKQHGSQTRASGDPYFSHPLKVADILAELHLDHQSIITALLHDVVEDTDSSLEDIKSMFGGEVAQLVDGVTKLSQLELQSEGSKQAENFRKLVLAISDDIRVLLVKLADRLDNMRTLHFITKEDKRKRIANETMEIYAPLAERIGMDRIKEELEDLSFMYLNAEARDSIKTRLDFLQKEGAFIVSSVQESLSSILGAGGLESFEVSGRLKAPYSIWMKMQRKAIEFEQLSDVMAFRIIVPSLGDCYQALGVLHSSFKTIPGRFKDYISTPKKNGYKSIHTGLIGPEGRRIEVQIRTQDMHREGELGVAAHWNYKQGDGTKEGRQYQWVRGLLEILDHAGGAEEFLEHTKLEMFQDEVFVFTPKNRVISLPRGATTVDFAYAVHSEVGDRCIGAKVNGRMRPLSTLLENGDQVQILTSKNSTPSPDWEHFVATGRARGAIRRFVRQSQRDQHIELGRQMLQKAFRLEQYDFTEKAVEGVIKKFKCENNGDLYQAIGLGHFTVREGLVGIFPSLKEKPAANRIQNIKRKPTGIKDDNFAVPIKGLIPGMAVHHARCCHPLPGDRIVGIVTTGKGVTIHTIDCDTLANFHDSPERWLDVRWDEDGLDGNHVGRLTIILNNEPGGLGELSTLIGRNNGNIINLKFTNRTVDFFELLVDIEVEDAKHLNNIIAVLRTSAAVSQVSRAKH